MFRIFRVNRCKVKHNGEIKFDSYISLIQDQHPIHLFHACNSSIYVPFASFVPDYKFFKGIEGGKLFIREYNSIHLQEQNWIVDQIKIIYKSTEF